jgi:hypothetical protein
MAAHLVSNVHVYDERGEVHVFGVDDDVPEWAARKMGAHCFEDGEHPFPESSADEGDTPPPKAGAGSSAEAWSKFAASKGVDVPADAKRDDVIAALEAAGVPTE